MIELTAACRFTALIWATLAGSYFHAYYETGEGWQLAFGTALAFAAILSVHTVECTVTTTTTITRSVSERTET